MRRKKYLSETKIDAFISYKEWTALYNPKLEPTPDRDIYEGMFTSTVDLPHDTKLVTRIFVFKKEPPIAEFDTYQCDVAELLYRKASEFATKAPDVSEP